MRVAYGVTVDDGGASESGDDPFNVTEHRDSESDSDYPFTVIIPAVHQMTKVTLINYYSCLIYYAPL